MKQTVCDRCGIVIDIDKNKGIIPMYKIIKMDHEILDLCHECAMELDSWLKNEGSDTDG